MIENDLLTLPEPRRTEEVGRADDPKYCPYDQLVSHAIEDCFILKRKIQDLVDSRLLAPFDSVKVSTDHVTITEGPLEENNLEIDDDEESADTNEDWMLFKSRALKRERNGLSPR